MSRYFSVSHCTANENGRREICIERRLTFVEWLCRAITRRHSGGTPTVKETWEFKGGWWFNKDTNEFASFDKHEELDNIAGKLLSVRWD